MAELPRKKQISINAPPEYEMKLLTAMAAFLGRDVSVQASAALAMYLRQAHDRILTQCEYYGQQWGMSKWQVLDLCYHHPEQVTVLMQGAGTVHAATDRADVFSDDDDSDSLS